MPLDATDSVIPLFIVFRRLVGGSEYRARVFHPAHLTPEPFTSGVRTPALYDSTSGPLQEKVSS